VEVNQSSPPPSINASGVLNAASSVAGALAPGSLASVYGSFYLSGLATATSFPFPYSLGGLALLFGGSIGAPLYVVTGTQANFQVPWEMAGLSQSTLSVTVNGQTSPAQTVSLAPFAPGIFSVNSEGTGQGAVLDSFYNLVDSSNPATAGSSAVQIFCTGLGAVSNQPASGAAAPSGPLSVTATVPTVMIGGAAATVLFSGLAPGSVGLYQVNALVPAGSSKGAAVPVTIAIGGATSNTVTIAVQ
jgi:uncharacterized protein (TIGR03437 family)